MSKPDQEQKPADTENTQVKEQKPADKKPSEPKALTAADAAKLVKRTVVVPGKKGEEPTTKEVDVKASEVLDFRDLGDRVVVVTNDGQKFYGEKAVK